jgi:hypothetical protein
LRPDHPARSRSALGLLLEALCALILTPTAAAQTRCPTLIEAEDSSLVDRADWSLWTGGVLHGGEAIGAAASTLGQARFRFSGTALTVYHRIGPRNDFFAVSVDGGPPTPVTQTANSFSYQVPTVIAQNLPMGTHDVVLWWMSESPQVDFFGDFGLPPGSVDTDLDCIVDSVDNCPLDFNPDQTDTDGDGFGDLCQGCAGDPAVDADGDCVDNPFDNCPNTSNPGQSDVDGDGVGDACDPCPGGAPPDTDGDCIEDLLDNCPNEFNDDQTDSDGDGAGDACDRCPGSPDQPDADLDCVLDGDDNCPNDNNRDQLDTDGDGVGDICDRCPQGPDEPDEDLDCVVDDDDNCPSNANEGQADSDGDGVGDLCDRCPGVPDEPDQDRDCFVTDLDCDDSDPQVHPGAEELPYDGIDQDCDGADLADLDGDGFDGGPSGPDCDDSHPGVHPGAEEAEGCNERDDDCDGIIDEGSICFDDDGDGFSERAGD